jgi:large subunit ribosomal protein L17
MAPAVKARRRVVQLLGDKQAARIVFEEVAPRFVDRPGGYTRILKLATPRLGDAGPRAILEFVGPEASAGRPQRPRVESARPVGT